MATTTVERLDRETGEFTTEEVEIEVVELGGETPLQKALADAVRAEFYSLTSAWYPSIEGALRMTRSRSTALLKELLNEAMQDLNDAVKPKQMKLPMPAKRPGERS
jgi:hypothetical protein